MLVSYPKIVVDTSGASIKRGKRWRLCL